MLYVTTRNNQDTFTAAHALSESRAGDGGFYYPLHAPGFSREMLSAASEKSFGQNIADVLNLFFPGKLTSWDVDFCIGRYPVRMEYLPNRVIMAETWHNPDWKYERIVSNLARHLLDGGDQIPGDWAFIAVRIAVLYSIFARLLADGIEEADVSVLSGDFSAPMSAWYARMYGLPIRNIICCCNENNALWDLICHGHMRTDAVNISTAIPEADVAVPDDLERLVYHCGGPEEMEDYLGRIRTGRPYFPSDAVLQAMRKGLYVSVVSSSRIPTTIPSVYRSHQYLHGPGSALAYAGLLDCRSKTGLTRHAVVLSEQSPICAAKTVADALGISEEELLRKF